MYKIPFEDFSEIREIAGGINVDYSFESVKPSIITCVPKITDAISQEVYDKAIYHYESDDYGQTGFEVLTNLVKYIQVPLWYFAWNEYMPWAQVNIDNDGIHVTKSDDRTAAFKYMTDAISQSAIQQAHNFMNELIAFLDKNVDVIVEWEDSEQYNESKELFIQNAKTFDKYFNINKSQYFYINLRNFIAEVQEDEILPRLGTECYDALKTAIIDQLLTDEDLLLLRKIRRAMVFKVMEMAIIRLSVQILPSGVFQNFISEFQVPDAKKAAPEDVKLKVSVMFHETGNRYLKALEDYITSITTEEELEADTEVIVTNVIPDLSSKYSEKKFFSL